MSNYSEIKNEYTNILIRILKPLLYEGIQSNYNVSLEKYNKIGKYKNLTILQIFQKTLLDIQLLNNSLLEIETDRIKSNSKCAEYFDNLVRAVIKSYIVLLANKNISIEIKISDFIHKCYIECGKTFYTCPQLFVHNLDCYELLRNKLKIYELIGESIKTAICKMLPLNDILISYLEYDDNVSNSQSENNSFGLCVDPNEIIIGDNIILNTDEDKNN